MLSRVSHSPISKKVRVAATLDGFGLVAVSVKATHHGLI
jgi:hypothetical protein